MAHPGDGPSAGRWSWLLERLVHIEQLDDGYALSFVGAGDLTGLRGTIETLIDGEKQRYPFLSFAAEVRFNRGVRLTITAGSAADAARHPLIQWVEGGRSGLDRHPASPRR